MAQRLWTPADMVGVTGIRYVDTSRYVVETTVEGATAVDSVTFLDATGAPTAMVAKSARSDYRPVLGSIDGRQTIYFDGETRQLPIADPSALAKGAGNKFWFGHFHALETRNGDYYPLGYGGGNGTGIAYKLRVGSRFTIDVGNFGFDVGTDPITGPASFVHVYEQTGTRSRAWLNAQASPTVYTANALNTSAANARLGSWPQYGNHSRHHLAIWGSAYGTPTVDDVIRLRAWCSWNGGAKGANLAADDPYKNAPPMIDDGVAENVGTASGSTTVSGAGQAISRGNGAAAGASTGAGAGLAVITATGTASAGTTAAGQGRAIAATSGTAAGTASAQGSGTGITTGTGTAAGRSTVAAEGRATIVTTGTAAGSSTAQASAPNASIITANGTAAGGSTVAGSISALASGTGTAAGATVAQASGRATIRTAGTASGGSVAAGAGRAIVAAIGTASGATATAGAGRSIAAATGSAAGSSTVSGRSPAAPQYPVPASRRVSLSDMAVRRVTLADTAPRRTTLADQAPRRVTIG